VSCPKLIYEYVTGVAHALHRLCETIHVLYPDVNMLAANGKKIFVISPAKTELSKTNLQTHSSNSSNDTLGNVVRCHCAFMQKHLKYRESTKSLRGFEKLWRANKFS
jgi:hypothetical protein